MDDAMCAAPSVDERIEGLRRDVNALYRLIPDNLEREERLRHEERWWATYNAALRATYFDAQDIRAEYLQRVDERHQAAVDAADRAHGPLEPATGA
jgi:hypothetical protein